METASCSTPSPRCPLLAWRLDSTHGFNPLLQTANGVHLTFFGSFVFNGVQVAGVAVNDLFAAYNRQNPGRQN